MILTLLTLIKTIEVNEGEINAVHYIDDEYNV